MYSALEVVDPPEKEPVSVDLARRHCRIDADYDDDLLETYIATARDQAEKYLNRALITQKLRYVLSNSPLPSASVLVPQSFISFPFNWPPLLRIPIKLPRAPCRELEVVTWGHRDDEPRIVDPEHYTINLAAQPALVQLANAFVPVYPAQSITFDFVAGYSDDPEDIPPMIRHAVLVLVAHLYENRGDVEGDFPVAAWRLLTPYRLFMI